MKAHNQISTMRNNRNLQPEIPRKVEPGRPPSLDPDGGRTIKQRQDFAPFSISGGSDQPVFAFRSKHWRSAKPQKQRNNLQRLSSASYSRSNTPTTSSQAIEFLPFPNQ
ncbi:hypothetical protein KSP40_PGU021508 [Platanthera guangdongensis]|uniref:Uncharacterized protein n=1 Tax=Platanthera guangdongensis TaxID=2320717 RepID=A0ABR2MEP8_9ASPA